jgi:hypothetical protein
MTYTRLLLLDGRRLGRKCTACVLVVDVRLLFIIIIIVIIWRPPATP